MDGQPKLTRTHSSLLRSSPTFRSSSVHSLSSIPDVEDPKPHGPRHNSAAAVNPSPPPLQWWRFPLIGAAITASVFLFLVYLKSEPSLFVALTILAAALLIAGKNKQLIFVLKKLRSSKNRAGNSSVEWYIGCENGEKPAAREGSESYSNGDFYEGEFHKGKCNGSGVYNYMVGSGRYEGDWVDGKYDGYGIESWARGSRYRGQYRRGLRHGFGLYRFYTGDAYAGEWCNGQYHGVGLQTCSDGSCYLGQFKCGIKHGLGSYHFRNEDRYAGEYFSDKIHGYGVYHFANGHCYEGSWHEGRKQGYGMYTFRSGETKSGEWDCGTLKTPLSHLADPVQRAVQAARKAAEDSIRLRRVDDQVSRSVRGANRAATAARVAAIKAVQSKMQGGKYLMDAY